MDNRRGLKSTLYFRSTKHLQTSSFTSPTVFAPGPVRRASCISKIIIRFLLKISFFPKFRFFSQNFDFCSKFRVFFFKISSSVQNFEFCSKFRFSFKISMFVHNFGVLFRISSFVLYKYKNFDFCSKFPFFISKIE